MQISINRKKTVLFCKQLSFTIVVGAAVWFKMSFLVWYVGVYLVKGL